MYTFGEFKGWLICQLRSWGLPIHDRLLRRHPQDDWLIPYEDVKKLEEWIAGIAFYAVTHPEYSVRVMHPKIADGHLLLGLHCLPAKNDVKRMFITQD